MAKPVRDREPILIAIMGPTGCGKSTFINTASGSDSMQVGHSLESCTEKIAFAEFEMDGRPITLIDTPGFDDTERPQANVLNQIATFLQNTFKAQRRLAGVIYMHRISDIRMNGVGIQNFRLFRKLCGDEAARNCILITNMWGEVPPKIGIDREQQLRDRYFKDALDRGARMKRHDGSVESAKDILAEMVNNQPMVLQVQGELVNEKKSIPQTQAGIELRTVLADLEKKHREQMRDLQDAYDAQKKVSADLLMELTKIKEALRKVEEERTNLERGITQIQLGQLLSIVKNILAADSPPPPRPPPPAPPPPLHLHLPLPLPIRLRLNPLQLHLPLCLFLHLPLRLFLHLP